MSKIICTKDGRRRIEAWRGEVKISREGARVHLRNRVDEDGYHEAEDDFSSILEAERHH